MHISWVSAEFCRSVPTLLGRRVGGSMGAISSPLGGRGKLIPSLCNETYLAAFGNETALSRYLTLPSYQHNYFPISDRNICKLGICRRLGPILILGGLVPPCRRRLTRAVIPASGRRVAALHLFPESVQGPLAPWTWGSWPPTLVSLQGVGGLLFLDHLPGWPGGRVAGWPLF